MCVCVFADAWSVWVCVRWEEDTEGVHVDLRQKSLDWLSECFEAAHQSARQAIDYMCNFIGMKVVLSSSWRLFDYTVVQTAHAQSRAHAKHHL